MNLRDYIESLNDFANEHPDYLDCEVICSADDEGNGYNLIIGCEPTPMFKYNHSEYYVEEEFEEEFEGDFIPNVICVN